MSGKRDYIDNATQHAEESMGDPTEDRLKIFCHFGCPEHRGGNCTCRNQEALRHYRKIKASGVTVMEHNMDLSKRLEKAEAEQGRLRELFRNEQVLRQRDHTENKGLREALDEAVALYEIITHGRKASTGAMNNTYTPQIDRKRLDRALDQARDALAGKQPVQETCCPMKGE